MLAWEALATAFACAAVILADILGRRFRQQMPIMKWVWPVTALYLGPVAVWGYHRWGRPSSARWQRENGSDATPDKPRWATVALGVSHCGAGCTLGDIVAEFGVYFLGATIAAQALFAEYVGDYILAVLLWLVFQFFAIAPNARADFLAGAQGCGQGRHLVTDRLRGRPVRVDGAAGAGAVSGAAPTAPALTGTGLACRSG